MRGDDIPIEAARNTIRTYCELHEKFDLFLTGHTESNMLIVARWGIGKSYYIKSKSDRRITHLMEGNLRPLKTYMELYENQHKLIVLDDAETLWADKAGRIILRELTDTSFPKMLTWMSTAKQLGQAGIPTSFSTNSRACIICNTFKFGRTDETAAIIDRCQCYYFDPTNEEVARYVADWFWDQVVMDYAATNLANINKLTARMFVRAAERRSHADPKWINEFPLIAGPEVVVQQILADEKFLTAQDRVKEFRRRTALLPEQDGMPMSRATFMRIQADLKARGQLGNSNVNLKVAGDKRVIPIGVEEILADVEKAAKLRQPDEPEDENVGKDVDGEFHETCDEECIHEW